MKHLYRFSPDYLSETWPLLLLAGRPGRAPRRARGDRPAGSAAPLARGPRPPIRGARIPALDARPVDSCAGFRSAAEATRPKKAKKFGQNWRISANSRFFTENSLQIRGPDSAVFWQFLEKTAKKGKKKRLSRRAHRHWTGSRTANGPRIEGPLLDFDLQRDDIRGSRAGFRPLLTRFRRTKGRLSSISCPVAVS